jgi:hypothetical protein
LFTCVDSLVGDSSLDADDEGLINIDEYYSLTDPCDIDTDDDDTDDDAEINGGSDPTDGRVGPSYEFFGPDTRITYADNSSDRPSMVFAGSEFGVAWNDVRGTDPREIYFTRISELGVKVGGDVRATTGGGDSRNPSMAWTGSEYGLAWRDSRNDEDVYFRRVSAVGGLVGADTRITYIWNDLNMPSLVWTGSEFGAAWQLWWAPNVIYFSRISQTGGAVGSPLEVPSVRGSVMPSLTFTGSEYGVFYPDSRSGVGEVFLTRLTSGGAKIGADVRVTNSPFGSGGPNAIFNGSEYGVGFISSRDGTAEVFFMRVGTNGINIGPERRITHYAVGPNLANPAVKNGEYGLVWCDGRNGDLDVYFTMLDPAQGKMGPDLRVTDNSSISTNARVAASANNFGIAWQDDRDGNYEIYFSLIGELDYDGDGLFILAEISAGTDPYDWDTDDDGMPDGFEVSSSGCGLDPTVYDAAADPDSDRFSNYREYVNNFDPCAAQ